MVWVTVNDTVLYKKSESIIKSIYGNDASFREGQYEAIEAVMKHKRSLIVQKTGWGKSLVYFTCASLMKKKGTVMVISPLLVLMDNQQKAAANAGLRCEMLNSTTFKRREEIFDNLINRRVDMLFVTPETVFKGDFLGYLPMMKISAVVIDEAHCISDWGHDFRLEYGRLNVIISKLHSSTKIIATTATAGNPVIKDLCKQLGGNVFVSKGSLLRKNLGIQMIKMENPVHRCGWILENINRLEGSGIVYCLTKNDCDNVAGFLRENGVKAEVYYSGLSGRQLRETQNLFYHNRIKVLVATVKLGMGYDKDDIAFVIHYQQPSNIVGYYQQIGRAGRGISRANAFLLYGDGDRKILDYFIENAFPEEWESKQVMEILGQKDGLTFNEILKKSNIKFNRLGKVLDFLCHEGFLITGKYRYFLSGKPFKFNRRHYNEIKGERQRGLELMTELELTEECYGRFIARVLDDPTAENCGCCSNCQKKEILPSKVGEKYIFLAEKYFSRLKIAIPPREYWIETAMTDLSKIEWVNKEGICLCRSGDEPFSQKITDGFEADRFDDELLEKSLAILKPIVEENGIIAVTNVPSRKKCVKDFAMRLAKRLNILYIEALTKNDIKPQSDARSTAEKCENALHGYKIKKGITLPDKILLADDTVHSRWSLTVCGYTLMENGCKEVYPFALESEQI